MTDLDRDDLDHLAISRLLARYADVVTRRAWPELGALFEPDATVTVDTQVGDAIELVGAERVGEFIGANVERFEFFELVPLNLVVDVDGDEASGRAYQVEVRQEQATGRHTNAYGLYTDRYVRRSGRWRFAERRYRSLARNGPDLTVFDRPT